MSQPSLSPDAPHGTLLHEFESARRLVVEDYVEQLPETERQAARRAIDEIAERLRSRFGSRPPQDAPNQTVDHRPASDEKPSAQPAAPSTVDESQGALIAPGTVDESQGALVTPGTVDESQGRPLPPPPTKKAFGRPVVPGYLVLSELGRGGMGVVYKARHLALDRIVALKMILGGAHVDDVQLARFHTEAQAVARLQHPGVVQVFEINEHDGLPYFSLEYVDGGSLAKKINRSPQPPKEAAELTEKIARAIAAAHARNIIHRDLKPANVLMTTDGSPKVTDFGLARRLEGDAGQTRSGSILGTPNYMAPEQARGDVENVGPLADVYSLGAILYELLTGKPPFQGTTVLETLELVEKQEPVPPVQLAPHVPKDLDTICLKCLQKEPGKRYQSAEELADDLRRFQEGRPIVARPTSQAERLWRLCKRNKVVSSLTALAGFLVLAGLVGLLVGLVVVTGAKNDAVYAQGKAEEAKEKAEEEEAKATKAKEVAEEDARKRAEATLQALGAIRTVIVNMRLRMRGNPQVVEIRKLLTEGVIKDLQGLDADVKNQPIKDRSVAAAHVNLGEIYVETGDYTTAKVHFDAGEAILLAMEKEDPDSAVAKRNMATIMNYQGDVAMHHGDGRAAHERYDKALRFRIQWHQMLDAEAAGNRKPTRTENRPAADKRGAYAALVAVAQSYGLLGRASLLMGDPQAALDYYRQSQKTYDDVPQWYYDKSDATLRLNYQRERTHTKRMLGKCYQQLREFDQARKLLATALDERVDRVVAAGKDAHAALRHDMIMSRWDMGDLELLIEDDPFAALGYYNSATASAAAIATKQEPDNPFYVLAYAYADYRMGAAFLRAARQLQGVEWGRWAGMSLEKVAPLWLAASRRHFERGRRTLDKIAGNDPADTGVQFLLMLTEARCGMRSAAVARTNALLKSSPNDRRVLFHSACCYALVSETGDAAQAKLDRDMALTLLEQSVKNGWKDLEALRIDPDLDALQGQPRLTALQRQLADATKKQ